MPTSGWNGKFEGVGNGGFAGAISYAGLAAAVARGYATASTDTGHRAGGTDAGWALGHPEKVVDFGYRAIHETAVAAKAIINGVLRRRAQDARTSTPARTAAARRSWKRSASPATMTASSPARPRITGRTFSPTASGTRRPCPTRRHTFPQPKLPAIEAAALQSCDANDGVKDGVLDSPDRCQFKPAALLCKGADSDACLTAPQVAALEKILGGIRGAKGQLYPGYVIGGITGGGGWGDWITGSAPGKSIGYAFGSNFFSNMVYEDRAWDYHALPARPRHEESGRQTRPDPQCDRSRPEQVPGPRRQADHLSRLERCRDHSAERDRVLQNHQETRAIRAPLHGPGYAALRRRSRPKRFRPVSRRRNADPEHDINAALERWVEEGVAPTQIIAKRENRTRPLCPYPQLATYKGDRQHRRRRQLHLQIIRWQATQPPNYSRSCFRYRSPAPTIPRARPAPPRQARRQSPLSAPSIRTRSYGSRAAAAAESS